MIRAWHMVPRLRTTIEHAHRIGVRLGTGSDTAYGPSSLVRISHEVAYLADMGLTPLEAIQAATITGAEPLMIEDRTGAVEPGLEADLLVVNDNPLENLLALQDPLLIVSNGRIALNRLTP
jgi:imidazolonepropionase-like amidohydrolase